jgi:hypothetical protein
MKTMLGGGSAAQAECAPEISASGVAAVAARTCRLVTAVGCLMSPQTNTAEQSAERARKRLDTIDFIVYIIDRMPAALTIEVAQAGLEEALEALPDYLPELPDALKPLARLAPPTGLHAKVSLRHGNKERQVKRNAPASSWSPEAGTISISYRVRKNAGQNTPRKRLVSASHDPVREMVQTLARAESGNRFVVLKWFRDTYLPHQGLAWAAMPEERHRVLADAIERRWILTSRIPNPRNPQFPATAIRVNRPLAEVRAILHQDAGERPHFAPIAIRGESLSATVLHERR